MSAACSPSSSFLSAGRCHQCATLSCHFLTSTTVTFHLGIGLPLTSRFLLEYEFKYLNEYSSTRGSPIWESDPIYFDMYRSGNGSVMTRLTISVWEDRNREVGLCDRLYSQYTVDHRSRPQGNYSEAGQEPNLHRKIRQKIIYRYQHDHLTDT